VGDRLRLPQDRRPVQTDSCVTTAHVPAGVAYRERLRLRPRRLWIVERMNFLQFAVEDSYAIKHSICSIRRFHVKNGGDVVPFDDVLLDSDVLNCRKNHRQKSGHGLPPGQGRHTRPLKGNIHREGDTGDHWRYLFRPDLSDTLQPPRLCPLVTIALLTSLPSPVGGVQG
jgi:hypothetical protein